MIVGKPFWHYERLLAPLLGIPLGLAIFYFYRLWMVPIPIEDFERMAVPTDVRSGTEVTIRWTERRTRKCRSLVSRMLIGSDGRIVSFEVLQGPPKPVGRITGEFTFIMPSFQVSGDVTYRVKSEFKCNWVQELLGGPIFPLQDLHFNYTKE